MSMFKMVFIAPVPNASRGGKQAWQLQASEARQPVGLNAATVDEAKSEAAAVWAGMAHTRFVDPDGYWITDARDQVVHFDERDEAVTPRSPEDQTRVAEFKRMLVAAGGGLVLVEQPEPEPVPGFECELDGSDLLHDADDHLDLADLVDAPDQRALIALHPVARDPGQLERTLAFLAGTRAEAGTVGDLERTWLAAAAGLAQMAEAGLLISAPATEFLRAA